MQEAILRTKGVRFVFHTFQAGSMERISGLKIKPAAASGETQG